MKDYRYCPRCGGDLRAATVDGYERRRCVGEACDFTYWNNPTPVVAAVVEHEGHIVLARNAAWPVKFFGLITGFLEARETPEVGVMREVGEELGLEASAAHFIGHYPFERMNQLIIAFHVPAAGEIRLNEELVDYRRLRPEQIKAWPAGTGLALRDWLRREHGIDPPMFDLSQGRRLSE